jgi:hypothetical protein
MDGWMDGYEIQVFLGKFLFYFFASILPLLFASFCYAFKFPERYIAMVQRKELQELVELWGFNG